MNNIWLDIRHGARSLAKRPTLTLTVLLSVVLGIGTNTAIFTVMDAVFLRPIPLESLDSLLYLYETDKDSPDPTDPQRFSYKKFLEYQERTQELSAITAMQRVEMSLAGSHEPQRVQGQVVAVNFFDVLEIEPAMGRFFRPEEARERQGGAVAVLSHGCWQRSFGADPDILGKTIRVSGYPVEVIGVGPRGFQGVEVDANVQLWVPLSLYEHVTPYAQYFSEWDTGLFFMLGRLAPGTSRAQAAAELKSIALQLEQEHDTEEHNVTTVFMPLRQATITPRERDRFLNYGRSLVIAVALVLLIACINVAHLLLVHGLDRNREIATRQALGASRGRLVRQLMTENALLFGVGGLLAIPFAYWSFRFLWHFRPPELSDSAVDLHFDPVVLGFLLAVTAVAGLVSGLVPAVRASRSDVVSDLKAQAGRSAGSSHRLNLRTLLVIPQIALALLALIGGGIFLRNLASARSIDLGFDAEHLLALSVAPGAQGYDGPRVRSYYDRLLERAEAIPGVEAAGLSAYRLLDGANLKRQIYHDGEDVPDKGDHRSRRRVSTSAPGFFDAVGIEIVAGRDFGSQDREDTRNVVIVNEALARHHWGSAREAVGKHLHFDEPVEPAFEVVGVIEDFTILYISEADDPDYIAYVPLSQHYVDSMVLHVRTAGDPAAMLPTVRREVTALDPAMPLAEVGTMASFIDRKLWLERTAATLFNLFALLALLLAAIGLYGLIRYTVRQRERELGIRMALGAGRGDVLRTVLGQTAAITLAGVVLGLLLAVFLLKPAIAGTLHGIEPLDPLTYAAGSILLLLVALASGYFPARRAAHSDPARVLRTE